MLVLVALLHALLHLIPWVLIPFIWWIFTARRQSKFLPWIGLKKPVLDWNPAIVTAGAVIVMIVLSRLLLLPLLLPADLGTVQLPYVGMGFVILPALLVRDMIQTGLGEELFFRGFLFGRLTEKLGSKAGNVVQAVAFGLVHGLPLFSLAWLTDALTVWVVVGTLSAAVVTGIAGWLLGYMTEKAAGGSIVPAVLAHGIANFAISAGYAFDLL